MKVIEKKSPTRVDLSGGTLDFWPLYLFLENPITVNVAINVFTYARLSPRTDQKVILKARDLDKSKEYAQLASCLSDSTDEFSLLRECVRYFNPSRGFELETWSESPVGGGLGGSSSLCVSIVRSFLEWTERSMTVSDMVRLCSNIEARVLKKPTGTQDYFPPILGGINFITYEVTGPRADVYPLSQIDFQNRFALVYTGKSHHSGINNWQVIKSYIDGDEATKKAFADIAQISKELAECVRRGDTKEFDQLFDREFEARVRLSDGFSSPELLKLQQIGKSLGASSKICGAGGGGCVLLWCKPGTRDQVKSSVEAEGFKVLQSVPWESLT